MSRHAELVRAIADEEKASMEDLLDIEDKAWNTLKYTNDKAYRELLEELEDLYYKIDKTEAQEIVRGMRPYGEYWSYDTVKNYLAQKGQSNLIEEFYIAMNMARNDYMETAKAYGAEDDPEFYFRIAKDFIMDEDAKPHKLAKYFKS